MIYLEPSALVKLLFEEPESCALASWLEAQTTPLVTSQLSVAELLRLCARRAPAVLASARRLLAGLDLVPVTADIVEVAGVIATPELPTLDALHLASARSLLPDLGGYVAYGIPRGDAARALGLLVTAPS